MVVGNLVRCRVQGGDTIGAFPVSGSVLAGNVTAFPGPDIEAAANVSDLVEIMSSTRRSADYCSRTPVQRPLPLPEDQRPASPFLTPTFSSKPYDYLLKFLLVGDSDVGKQEILSTLEEVASDTPYSTGPAHKVTTLLVDGRKIRLQLWDTSGQGRFCTILRSYSRGAQGVMLVYDITNKWSFDGIDRWLREVEEHAPGIPKVLVGNRLHLEFKRAVSVSQAVSYAKRHGMSFFEISPLCNYNVAESLAELTRRALKRNGMERLWRTNRVLSLQEMCCRTIVTNTSVYAIDRLPLPPSLRSQLRSYALSNGTSVTNFRSWNRNKNSGSSSRSGDSKSSSQVKKCSAPDSSHVKMNCVVS